MNLFRRLLWLVNRSAFGRLVKLAACVWHLGEKRQRRRAADALPVSTPLRQKAEALNRDGYAIVTDVMDPVLSQELAAAGLEKLSRLDELAAKQRYTHKKFWVRLLDGDMQDRKLSADNVFVRYALQPSILGVVATAMKEVPTLEYVLLAASRHTDEEMGYSQFWHRDYDDLRTIKLFTYLTDVLEDGDGPFTFLPRAPTRRLGRNFLSSHLPDERVFRKVNRSHVHVMRAPRLASFLVETSACLHMGSRMAPGHTRLLYTATYRSFPRMYPSTGRPFRAGARTTALERMVMAI